MDSDYRYNSNEAWVELINRAVDDFETALIEAWIKEAEELNARQSK